MNKNFKMTLEIKPDINRTDRLNELLYVNKVIEHFQEMHRTVIDDCENIKELQKILLEKGYSTYTENTDHLYLVWMEE